MNSALTTRFTRLQPGRSTHLRQQLIEHVRTGELDGALAFLSADDNPPGDVEEFRDHFAEREIR